MDILSPVKFKTSEGQFYFYGQWEWFYKVDVFAIHADELGENDWFEYDTSSNNHNTDISLQSVKMEGVKFARTKPFSPLISITDDDKEFFDTEDTEVGIF